MRRNRERGGGRDDETSRRRGDATFKAILQYVALAGAGWSGVEGLTFAELVVLGETNRVEAWDRAAFVATYACNANPFLRRPVNVANPYRESESSGKPERVRLEDVFPDAHPVSSPGHVEPRNNCRDPDYESD